MKKMLFALALLPSFVYAQKIEMSVLGGIALNKMTAWSGSANSKSPASPSLSLQLAYTTKKFDYGIRADLYRLKVADPINNIVPGGEFFYSDIRYSYYPTAFNFSLFANWKKAIRKSSVFAGPQVGFAFGTRPSFTYAEPNPGPEPFYNVAPHGATGITLGLQAGYAYALSPNLRLRSEIAPRFLYSLTEGGDQDVDHSLNTLVVPVSVGVSYSF